LTINGQLSKITIVHCFDAIFKSQNAPNSKFSSAPQAPYLVGRGLAAPLQEPLPALGPSGLERRPVGPRTL